MKLCKFDIILRLRETCFVSHYTCFIILKYMLHVEMFLFLFFFVGFSNFGLDGTSYTKS